MKQHSNDEWGRNKPRQFNVNKKYNNNLAAIRIDKGYTLANLAIAVGIPVQNASRISCLEHATISPLFTKDNMRYIKPWVAKICEVLDVAIDDVFSDCTGLSVAPDVVFFKKDSVKRYLDRCIRHWREKRGKDNKMAMYYVDAFQSVRMSLFGELLSETSD